MAIKLTSTTPKPGKATTASPPADAALRDLITKQEASELLGVAGRTLDRWAAVGLGPSRIKFGNNIRYRKAAVAEWLLAHETAAPREP